MNKPSVTKIETADRVNLLHSTSCKFGKYHLENLAEGLYSCPDMHAPFHDSH